MKILVTGGTGFIGAHTLDRLLQLGHTPLVLDHHPNPKRTTALLQLGVGVALGDVRDITAVDSLVAQSDGVIHLAGVLGTAETINEPTPAVDTNIFGSLNVFQACRRNNKPCSYITVGNYWMNNSYSITKTTAERFAWMFNREHGTKISVVRALNAYGPGQKVGPVRKIMPNFVIPALRDEEITVYGDGSQIMDMIYVDDVADIMIRALLVDHGQHRFDPRRDDREDDVPRFEAGTGRHTTVLEIAQMVIACAGKGRIKHAPMRPGEPEQSIVVGDPETLRPLYNGELPQLTCLEEGIERTIKWYKETGHAGNN